MRLNLTFAAIIAALSLVAVACGDDDDAPDATATAGQPAASPTIAGNPTPASTPTAGAGETGIPSLDAALASLRAADAAALSAMAEVQEIACVTEPMGIGGPPICEAGEADGMVVRVFPVAQCEGSYIREGAIRGAIDELFGGTVDVYGVYRTVPQYYPDGTYTIVLEVEGDDRTWTAREVVLDDEGITGINYGCAESAEVLVQNRQLTDAIIAPG
jgi:hypothetical protein